VRLPAVGVTVMRTIRWTVTVTCVPAGAHDAVPALVAPHVACAEAIDALAAKAKVARENFANARIAVLTWSAKGCRHQLNCRRDDDWTHERSCRAAQSPYSAHDTYSIGTEVGRPSQSDG
jgi:hypothetical protein